MSGIYLHIPYCRHKCNYCNFYSLASNKYREELLPALRKEIALQQYYLEGEPVETIYFGGGTPSLLKQDELESLIAGIHKYFSITASAEVTLEANPDDLNFSKLNELKKAGVNRLSIGVQSFIDKDLRFLERRHSGSQARDCITRAQDAGFSNLSIDLIYGIPTLESKGWESNLQLATESGIPHISAYALTVEEKTPLSLHIQLGKLPGIEDERQLEHFNLLTASLPESGYEHYEISNFCKPGMYSKHNTSYWQGKKYLGIGPSAHSYNGSSRQWNVANLGLYISAMSKGEVLFEKEILTTAQRYNEYVMTSLRTMWGCDLDLIRAKFGAGFLAQALSDARQFLENGMLVQRAQVLHLTDKGLFHADGIASAFFKVD